MPGTVPITNTGMLCAMHAFFFDGMHPFLVIQHYQVDHYPHQRQVAHTLNVSGQNLSWGKLESLLMLWMIRDCTQGSISTNSKCTYAGASWHLMEHQLERESIWGRGMSTVA